ncbi:MAG: crossover junction endodeoxyribonuclease RuvC [Oscillospiraceae bacterium]|nr:crossover junction endodeoxyribonuclease RuvC [Oscillospiraceae bacterium]
MTVLGIDPGLAICGFGLLETRGREIAHIRHGAIRTKPGAALKDRLLTIFDDLTELIAAFSPHEAVAEEMFFGKNAKTGLPVAHARGVALLALAKAGLPVYEYKPAQIKQAVVGYGKAEKRQVMEMTRCLLKLPKIPRPDDAADALAAAITHINMRGTR